MGISVVVPTRDRPESLRRCLGALSSQDVDRLDVVVVDDGSRDRAALQAALRGAPEVRCLHTPARGPAAARNLGAAATKGEIICFTDDDCEPEPSWARRLGAAARSSGVAAGRTVAPTDAPAPVLASQVIIDHLLTVSLDGTASTRFAPSCNLAVARDVFKRLRFDERYRDAAGEDRDFSVRAAAIGAAPRYEPAAIAVHRQALDAATFLRQQFRYGRGAARFRHFGPGDRILAEPSSYANLIRSGFERGAIVGGWVIAAQLATALGIAAEAASILARRSGGEAA
jgi:glycosyltransferase involved in cell wall biosynthesis